MAAYQHSRLRQGKNLMSDTRYTLDWIVEAASPASPMKCLETNIYAMPGTDLTEKEQNTELFDYLLVRIKPKLVVAHGKMATKYLQANPPECQLKCVTHFSAQPGWFDMKLIELFKRLRTQRG